MANRRRLFAFAALQDAPKTSNREILLSSVPIGLGLFVNTAFTTADRFLLSGFFDFETVAVYSFALQIAAVLGIFGQAGQLSYMPRIFQLTKKREIGQLSLILALLLVALIICGFGLFFAFRFSLNFDLWGQYNSENPYLALTIIVIILNSYLVILTSMNIYLDQGKYILAIQICGLALNVGLSVALMPSFGPMAVLYGSISAGLTMIVATLVFSIKGMTGQPEKSTA